MARRGNHGAQKQWLLAYLPKHGREELVLILACFALFLSVAQVNAEKVDLNRVNKGHATGTLTDSSFSSSEEPAQFAHDVGGAVGEAAQGEGVRSATLHQSTQLIDWQPCRLQSDLSI